MVDIDIRGTTIALLILAKINGEYEWIFKLGDVIRLRADDYLFVGEVLVETMAECSNPEEFKKLIGTDWSREIRR